MNPIAEFKPKLLVYISVFLFLIIGTVAPFLIYFQTVKFDVRAYLRICIPLFALIPSIIALRKIKVIQIDATEWTVRYFFTGKTIVFSKNEVKDTVVSEHKRYRSGVPYTNWKITLCSGEIIQFSSNELKNTDQIASHFRKLQNRK